MCKTCRVSDDDQITRQAVRRKGGWTRERVVLSLWSLYPAFTKNVVLNPKRFFYLLQVNLWFIRQTMNTKHVTAVSVLTRGVWLVWGHHTILHTILYWNLIAPLLIKYAEPLQWQENVPLHSESYRIFPVCLHCDEVKVHLCVWMNISWLSLLGFVEVTWGLGQQIQVWNPFSRQTEA